MSRQNDIEHLIDLMDLGKMTADEANVQMVRNQRVEEVTKLPREVRSALNKAVKEKKLGHLKKDGIKPEVYFHPDFRDDAVEIRAKRVNAHIRAMKKICK